MFNAIQARYAGPTNHRGSRILVRSAAGRTVFGWEHALNRDDNYKAAIEAHCVAVKWTGRAWTLGMLADGSVVAVCS